MHGAGKHTESMLAARRLFASACPEGGRRRASHRRGDEKDLSSRARHHFKSISTVIIDHDGPTTFVPALGRYYSPPWMLPCIYNTLQALTFISTRRTTSVSLSAHDDDDHQTSFLASAVVGLVLATTTFLPLEAPAYEASDYASETVTQAVKSLTDAQGNPDNTFSAFEGLEAIITEGKGVGGSINYRKYKPSIQNVDNI